MIVGLGIDVLEVGRMAELLKRYGPRLWHRILTVQEIEQARGDPARFLASRWASKEAAAKALGTGFASGVTWKHIRVDGPPGEAPALFLEGPAQARMEEVGARRAMLSLSHSRGLAVAVVVLEG